MFATKRYLILISLAMFGVLPLSASAANLLEVYEQAQMNDTQYQQAVAQRLATKEGVPISAAALMPNISGVIAPQITRTGISGSSLLTDVNGEPVNPRNNTQRAYTMTLSLTQTVFNFAQFSQVAGAVSTSKGADATLNAAAQSLMTRVTQAYLAILQDEDTVSYNEASKIAYAEQLDQAKQQYNVGLKTITDVYTAQARYDSSVASYIAAKTQLANDRENLRVITGKYYPHLAKLSENFPLITPKPADVERWVDTSLQQNWNIKAAQYNVSTARQTIRQQFSGHLPTLNMQVSAQRQYQNNINNYDAIIERNGPGTTTTKEVALNLNIPIFAGGGVVAQTNQATYNYQVAQQQLEQTVRETVNSTRQSYLNVLSGISQIEADKQAIKSNISSLEGMEASYKVGTETLVNVLNQQETLLKSQTTYATDRYAFVNNVLALKQAAGTLGFDDLRAVNAWLIDEPTTTVVRHPVKSTSLHKKRHLVQAIKIKKHRRLG